MWTKTAPTEPGYYWYRYDKINCTKGTEIVQCTTYMGNIRFECVNWSGEYDTKEMLMNNGEFWSERIVPPYEAVVATSQKKIMMEGVE